MPLEIRELVIKTSISQSNQGSAQPHHSAMGELDQSALITACVEKVLDLLKEKAER